MHIINGIAFDDLSKVNGVDTGSIHKVNGVIIPPSFPNNYTAEFNGVTSYAATSVNWGVHRGLTEFSIGAWVRSDVAITNNYRWVISNYNNAWLRGFYLRLAGAKDDPAPGWNAYPLFDVYENEVFPNNVRQSIRGYTPLAQGQVHLVVVTGKIGGDLEIWSGGVLDNSAPCTLSQFSAPNTTLNVGSVNGSSSLIWQGAIDEPFILNKQMTPSDHVNLFNLGPSYLLNTLSANLLWMARMENDLTDLKGNYDLSNTDVTFASPGLT
jgi:hypothetical protein